MNRAPVGLLLCWLCVGIHAAELRAAAYGVYEHGASALGAAGAFAATADDASAIFYNPAGIARLQGSHVTIGGSVSVSRLEFSGTAPYPGNGVEEKWPNTAALSPHLFSTFHLGDYVVGGLGLYAPFWLSTEWERPETFTGRYIMTRANVRGYYLNPTLATELTPSLSLGAGVDVVISDAEFVRYEPTIVFSGPRVVVIDLATMTFESEPSLGLTFNAGLLLDWSSWRFGLTYRHGVTNAFSGDADFGFITTGNAEADAQLRDRVPPDQHARVDFPFPATATIAAAWEIADGWRAEVDLGWTRWSVFDALELRFDEGGGAGRYPHGYEDKLNVRAGLAVPAGPKLGLRAGFLYDPTPAPSWAVGPILPDSDRYGITAGFGYAFDRWRLDLYEGLFFFDEIHVRDSIEEFNGDYDAVDWRFGVSVGHGF